MGSEKVHIPFLFFFFFFLNCLSPSLVVTGEGQKVMEVGFLRGVWVFCV